MSDIPKCMNKETYNQLALKLHTDKNSGCSPDDLILAKNKMQELVKNKDAQIEKYGELSEESLTKCTANNQDVKSTTIPDGKCLEYPSLLSTVPPECTVPGPQPQFHDLMKAAIRAPVDKAIESASELAGDALKATGNAALVKIATEEALGPKDAKILNELSKDPKVAAELAKFQNNMSNVVEKSIEDVTNQIKEPVEKAAEQLATGIITTGTSALASVTGPLVPLATIAGTAGQLVNEATEITGAVKDAQKEVGQAMSQVTDVQKALDEAAKNAIPEVKPEVPKLEVPEVKVPEVKVSVPEVKVAPAASGGSRKRRRIQKLSRRIERTLRRVQKKYGLRDDKNSFLRRTLRSNKH